MSALRPGGGIQMRSESDASIFWLRFLAGFVVLGGSWFVEVRSTMKVHWARLHTLALAELEATLGAMPAPLRVRAQALPVTFERRPDRAQLREGIEPDTLGLFVGPEFADEERATMPLPPQIILFLENIWDQAQADETLFREEVRTTLLHELGHYLGLDEDGLIERGLE